MFNFKGVSWWEIDIKLEMGKAPVEAFGIAPFLLTNQQEYANKSTTEEY